MEDHLGLVRELAEKWTREAEEEAAKEAPLEEQAPEVEQEEEAPVEEAPEPKKQTVPVRQPEPAQETESVQSKNFREMRQEMARAQRERDEYARRLKELEEARNAPKPEPEENYSLAPDDIAEGKHLSVVDKKVKRLEQELEKQRKAVHESAVERRVMQNFPDYYSVVSQENIELLNEREPELAHAIASAPDLYTKSVSAYKAIKRLETPKAPEPYKEEIALAQKNAAKPRPVSSIAPQKGDGPLTHANAFANGLTPELKRQLFAEMMEAKKNY